MNTTLSPQNSAYKASSQTQSSSKFLLFQVGQLHLALSVDRVQKIINYTPIFGSGLGAVGVAHIGEQEITVIDLHRRFFRTSQKIEKGYLILSKAKMGETFALWVAQTPTLVDVALSQIRTLPESYRRADTLDAASHVMLLPHQEGTMTVFVLDVNRLVENSSV